MSNAASPLEQRPAEMDIDEAYEGVNALEASQAKLNGDSHNVAQRARFAVDDTIARMNILRATIDEIEGRIPADDFPFPTYQDLMHKRH